jgi:SAM-dependent methyltransferase
MSSYAEAAEFYDLLYQDQKDYPAEAELLRREILAACPTARTILDVGCGTGAHARALIDAGFEVDGIDLEPRFIEIARGKCPEGRFEVGDMTDFHLPTRYDVVTCLFSVIGYARSLDRLQAAIRCMARHVDQHGVLVVDPWFEAEQLTDGWITTISGEGGGYSVSRMSRTVIDGSVSRLEFEYLIGSAAGLQRRSEVHELGLFSQAEMKAAFAGAGLTVERRPEALRTRGLYMARVPPS